MAPLQEEPLEALIRKPVHLKNARKSKSASKLQSLQKTVKAHRPNYQKRLRSYRTAPFVDSGFKTNRSSLYRSTDQSKQKYDQLITRWLRIGEVKLGQEGKSEEKPSKLVVYGGRSGLEHFHQGTLGNCWFVCSLASLVYRHYGQLKRIIPDRSVRPEGAFQVFLCVDGQWTPVELDDYFPVDQWARLVFADACGGQLFAPLIEKALAKQHRCYKALSAGTVFEGFSNLTGMPVERYELAGDKQQPELVMRKIIANLRKLNYLVSANCGRTSNGLDSDHAYALLDAINTKKTQVVLLWNPWGKQELNGSFQEFNELMKRKKPKVKLLPGMFWLQLADFVRCFDQLDICKLSSKWSEKRFEFTLPFSLTDQLNFTVFEVKCSKSTYFQFTIYQRVNRELELPYQLELSLVVFRRLRDGSLRFVWTSRVATETDISSHGKTLPRGTYLLAVLGFNHWGVTSRLRDTPVLRIAFHGTKKFSTKPLTADTHLLGDLMIELAVAIGERQSNPQQKWCQFTVPEGKFCSRICAVENRNPDRHVTVHYDTGSSENAFSLRSAKRTSDIVPPNCRQLVSILSPECDKPEYNYVTNSNISLTAPNAKFLTPHYDIREQSGLFAPRAIDVRAKVERTRPAEPVRIKEEREDDLSQTQSWCTIC